MARRMVHLVSLISLDRVSTRLPLAPSPHRTTVWNGAVGHRGDGIAGGGNTMTGAGDGQVRIVVPDDAPSVLDGTAAHQRLAELGSVELYTTEAGSREEL